MTDLAFKLQAKHHFTVAYAPWSNGQVERKNRDVRDTVSVAVAMEAADVCLA